MFRTPLSARSLRFALSTPQSNPLYQPNLTHHALPRPKPQYARYRSQYNRRPQYQRFGGQQGNLFQRWAARPTFYREVGGVTAVGAGFYVFNLETVPVRVSTRLRKPPKSAQHG